MSIGADQPRMWTPKVSGVQLGRAPGAAWPSERVSGGIRGRAQDTVRVPIVLASAEHSAGPQWCPPPLTCSRGAFPASLGTGGIPNELRHLRAPVQWAASLSSIIWPSLFETLSLSCARAHTHTQTSYPLESQQQAFVVSRGRQTSRKCAPTASGDTRELLPFVTPCPWSRRLAPAYAASAQWWRL